MGAVKGGVVQEEDLTLVVATVVVSTLLYLLTPGCIGGLRIVGNV